MRHKDGDQVEELSQEYGGLDREHCVPSHYHLQTEDVVTFSLFFFSPLISCIFTLYLNVFAVNSREFYECSNLAKVIGRS